jgi:hypothetical protein
MTDDFTSLTYPAKSKKVATIRRFANLRAWQKARKLAKDVYKTSDQRAFSRDFTPKTKFRMPQAA